MDNAVLKKKLNTYKSPKGVLKGMSNDVIIEVLQAWQNWPGPTSELYRDLDLSKGQMSALIRVAKKLVKSGVVPESDFKEIKIEESPSNLNSLTSGPCTGVEILWDSGKLIRFQQVEQLVDFLKKVA
jgi:hypothetical protein